MPNRCEPSSLKRADGREAVVLHQDDVQLDPLGHRGDDLGRHHQVGPVADEHEHLTPRVGQLGPQAAGDLVPHAGVPVLDVVLLGSRARHSICRSPGMLPAACTTTSRSSMNSLSTPRISVWAGSGR